MKSDVLSVTGARLARVARRARQWALPGLLLLFVLLPAILLGARPEVTSWLFGATALALGLGLLWYRRHAAELAAAGAHADTVLDTAADGIVTMDGNGRVLSCNQAAGKL